MIERIQKMHEKFKMSPSDVPFSEKEKEFRVTAMREEIDEYEDIARPFLSEYEMYLSLADELDALVDLIVFALGTVDRQGMSSIFEEAFEKVMAANCKKEVGPNQKRGSFQLDLIKPEGWESPDLVPLVKKLIEQNKTNRSGDQTEFEF
jgi:predicted HAD superfamily Cof-like phosphohydrolase